MTKGITKKNPEFDTSRIIERTLQRLTAGLTGIASSKREDWFLSLGHIFQRLRGREFLTQLLHEWNNYVIKGLIKDGYENTEQHKVCFQELLDFLDNDSPDQVRFTALKRIFLTAATEQVSSRESVLPSQLMRICRTLSSGEILVLESAYRVLKVGKWNDRTISGASGWLGAVANESGLKYSALVTTYESELIQKHLLTGRVYEDGSGVHLLPSFRLTDLAVRLCDFIQNSDSQRENTSHANGT